MRHLIRAGLPLFILVVACSTGSELAAPSEPATILRAPANKALVAFIRDTHHHDGTGEFDIMDETGKVYGASTPDSHFFVHVEPGHHMFIKADSRSVSVVDATVAPGKIYFVHIEVSTNEEAELYAIRPGTRAWENVTDWLDQTHEELAPPSQRNARSLVAYGLAAWKAYDPDDKDQHRLRPYDGIPRVRLDD